MPRTPDRFPGDREEELVYLVPGASAPTQNGEFTYVTGVGFRFYEEGSVKGLTGSGISDATHKTLRQLIHLADNDGPMEGFTSGAYEETTPAGDPFPTSKIWWTSSAKTAKIVEETISWNANKTVNTDEWKAYDTDGSTVLVTMTDTYDYSGGNFLTPKRTRTLT